MFQEQWYRYNANTGTFWVHRWIHNGADRRKIGEVKTARNYIAQAIKIKPDAHFGREKYQLQVMDWIVAGQPYQTQSYSVTTVYPTGGHTTIIANTDPNVLLGSHLGGDTGETKALCGLITLGNAWESVDVFDALSHSLRPWRSEQAAYLVNLRCRELIDAGHGSLTPGAPTGETLKMALRLNEGYRARTSEDERIYRQLRSEADAWQKKRTDYMMARLTAGRHPDTDPTFWNDWHDPGPPHIGIPWDRWLYLTMGRILGLDEGSFDLLMFLAAFIGAIVLLRFWLRRRKRRSLITN